MMGEGGGGKHPAKPKNDYTAREIAISISKVELHSVLAIENPKKELELVGAAVLIMLSPGKDIPKDVSWAGFKKAIKGNSFHQKISALDSSAIRGFKARALKPFLQNDKFLPAKMASISLCCAKLASWAFVTLKSVPEFDWPESLLLDVVLEGMDGFLRPRTVEQQKLEKEAEAGKKKKKKPKPISDRLAAPKKDFSEPDYPVRQVIKQPTTSNNKLQKRLNKPKKNVTPPVVPPAPTPAPAKVATKPKPETKKSPVKSSPVKAAAAKSPTETTTTPNKKTDTVVFVEAKPEPEPEDPEQIFADEYGDDFAEEKKEEVLDEPVMDEPVVDEPVVVELVVESEVEDVPLKVESEVAEDEEEDYDDDGYGDEFEAESPAKPKLNTPKNPPPQKSPKPASPSKDDEEEYGNDYDEEFE